MNIVVARRPHALELILEGSFLAGAVPEFERVTAGQPQAGACRMILNLAGLTFISSAGLCSLLAVAKRLREQNGRLAVCNVEGEIRQVFEMSGFAALLPIFPNAAAAEQYLQNDPA